GAPALVEEYESGMVDLEEGQYEEGQYEAQPEYEYAEGEYAEGEYATETYEDDEQQERLLGHGRIRRDRIRRDHTRRDRVAVHEELAVADTRELDRLDVVEALEQAAERLGRLELRSVHAQQDVARSQITAGCTQLRIIRPHPRDHPALEAP